MPDLIFLDPLASSVYPTLLLSDSNLYIVRGDSKTLNRQAMVNGVAVDITGGTLRMTAKRRYADQDSDAVFTKTIGNGITITNPAQGLFTVAIVPADTRTVSGLDENNDSEVPILLVYDLQLKDVNGSIYTGQRGQLTVLPDVSVTA